MRDVAGHVQDNITITYRVYDEYEHKNDDALISATSNITMTSQRDSR
jgi:hypothetical protein